MIGTLVNTATVLVGSATGLFVRALGVKGRKQSAPLGSLSGDMTRIAAIRDRVPEQKWNRVPEQALDHSTTGSLGHSILIGLGLATIALGIKMALQAKQMLIVILSVVLGGLCGQVVGIEEALERLGERLKRLSGVGGHDPNRVWGHDPNRRDSGSCPQTEVESCPQTSACPQTEATFVSGFVAASVLFCAGPMTILGSIQDGLQHDPKLLLIKSLMDGVSSIILASTLGIGVIFSALTVLVLQGLLTILAAQLNFLTQPVYLNDFTAVGGLIVLALGIRLAGIKDIKAGNFLPALIFVVLLVFAAAQLHLIS